MKWNKQQKKMINMIHDILDDIIEQKRDLTYDESYEFEKRIFSLSLSVWPWSLVFFVI